MKNITKKYLKKEIEELEESNSIMNMAAMGNPFGANIDLEEVAEDYLKKAEQRVRTEIWQKHRISVLRQLLEELD